MKKWFPLVSVFFIIFLFSCSNNDLIDSDENNPNNLNKDSCTLKTVLSEKDENTIWTKELEPEILTYKIRDEDLIVGSNVDMSSEVLNLFSSRKTPVYPDLGNFGNLDTSCLTEYALSRINSFFQDVSENPYGEKNNYFESKYLFNYVFFLNDMRVNWNEKMGKSFPEKSLFKSDEEESTSDETTTDSEKSVKESKKISKPILFTKWVLGEPFVSEQIIQLPVRLYVSNKYLDVNLFIKNTESLNIYNIDIITWGGR